MRDLQEPTPPIRGKDATKPRTTVFAWNHDLLNNSMSDFKVNDCRIHLQDLAACSFPDFMSSRVHAFPQMAGESELRSWAKGVAIPVDNRDMMTPTSKIGERIRVFIAVLLVEMAGLIVLFSWRDAYFKILLAVYAGFEVPFIRLGIPQCAQNIGKYVRLDRIKVGVLMKIVMG